MLPKKFQLMSLVAMTVLLAATGAFASDAPLQCTTGGGGNWTVTAVGPLSITCPGGGDCTQVNYTIVANKGLIPDHVAILAEHDVTIVIPESRFVSAPCTGDTVTLLGARDCSSQAVRINRNSETGAFELAIEGLTNLSGSSIVVKKGKVIEQCRIASLGQVSFNPNEQRLVSREVTFKGCAITIPVDPITGEGGEATLRGENCHFVANGLPAGIAKLIVDGKDTGSLTWGEGYTSGGTDSCNTTFVKGRLYTICVCAPGVPVPCP